MSKSDPPKDVLGLAPLALIAGPTASGKSDLAVRLATASAKAGRRGVVINADSAQVYRDLNVLSARPSPDEMQGVEHRLFGTWDGAQPCSAADWAAAARREIAACHGGGLLPILVGGTGMYIRVLLDGIAPVPAIDPALREAVRALSPATARAALVAEDPLAAARLAPADRARTMRALEVVRSTGRTLADWQAERVGGIGDKVSLRPLVLLPDRENLYQHCDRRFAAMIDNGAIEEVRLLLDRCLPADLPVMRAIGVREIAAWLREDVDYATMIETGQQATRNYAKRQYTWFRNQLPHGWTVLRTNMSVECGIFDRILR